MSESNNTEQVVPEKAETKPQGGMSTPVAIVIAGVIVAGAIIFSNNGGVALFPSQNTDSTAQEEVSQEELLALAAIQEGDHIRGNKDADIYILEFSDTECPYCKQFHTTMKQVLNQYNGEVAWVYRHFPLASLHPTAPREAEALECANDMGGPDIFWAYTDTVYERTPQGAALTDDQLFDFAQELGLSRDVFMECVNSGKFTEEVQKDLQNAIDLGGRGTPHSLIISGDTITPINGAQPFNVVKASLDALMTES